MRKPDKNKMAGVNSRFASVSESEILKIQEDALPENAKKATKFGMKDFPCSKILQIRACFVLLARFPRMN